jgi:hypothetical protein
MIEGGYYIKARCIQESEISICSPVVRELWDWLLREANHKDVEIHGYTTKRGQCFRTIKDMREGLKWQIGYRFERYNEEVMKNAMKKLRSLSMITTTKTPRGNLITICNYDKYQNPHNYELPNENPIRLPTDSRPTPDGGLSINKNVKNDKNDKNKRKYIKEKFSIPTIEQVSEYCRERNNEIDPERFVDFYTSKNWMIGKNKMKDWKAAIRTWEKNSKQSSPDQDIEESRLL